MWLLNVASQQAAYVVRRSGHVESGSDLPGLQSVSTAGPVEPPSMPARWLPRVFRADSFTIDLRRSVPIHKLFALLRRREPEAYFVKAAVCILISELVQIVVAIS